MIIASMINLVITVTLYKHQESHLPRNLTRNTKQNQAKRTTGNCTSVVYKAYDKEDAEKDTQVLLGGEVGLLTFWKMKETFSFILSRKGSARV